MKRWWLFLLLAYCGLALSGCQLVAGFFRWAAGVAESPEAEQGAATVAQALGIGPLWGWISAFGASAAAVLFGKSARTNGKLVSALTGGLEESKVYRTPEEAATLQLVFKLIQASAAKLGVDSKLDAALAKRGHNIEPILRTVLAATEDPPEDDVSK